MNQLPKKDQIAEELNVITKVVSQFQNGASINELRAALDFKIDLRTLQRRLEKLIQTGILKPSGETRRTKYHTTDSNKTSKVTKKTDTARTIDATPLSEESREIMEALSTPFEKRKRSGYNRKFPDEYRPNIDYYLSANERLELRKNGETSTGIKEPAGTYARNILHRLLIDLSWNSSRLEGNTYSLLDTERLLSEGIPASEKTAAEAQMILNHKEAIEFLVRSASEIAVDPYTIRNLHAILSNGLLPDPAAPGRLRTYPVGIKKSAYTPTDIPQLIEEMFKVILEKASAITDPYEQALFLMVQLPYLQPFEDVNKRVSRLAANIPLNQHNLIPLSFIDVPDDLYIQGLLGVYELNKTELLKDVFIWACNRSADRYARIRQTIGEPDPFRMKYRTMLQSLVSEIVSQSMKIEDASLLTKARALQLPAADHGKFVELVETELLSLHEGNFARYKITPGEFERWRKRWNK